MNHTSDETVSSSSPSASSTARTSVVPRLLVTSVAMLLLGVAGGFVWLWLARPAEWEVVEGNIVLTEAAATGQFSVIVLFVLIGAVSSLVWGWLATWALDDLGWVTTPVVVVMTSLAALLAWRLGVELGPPDPATVTGVVVGDTIPSQLKVDGLAPFLVWPIFGLVGVVGATWVARQRP